MSTIATLQVGYSEPTLQWVEDEVVNQKGTSLEQTPEYPE